LNVKSCAGKSRCSFFKTLWEHEEDLEAANMRLRRLPEEVQTEIAAKYHCGRMPWRKGHI